MDINEHRPDQNKLSLAFKDVNLEREFRTSYDKSVRIPLRFGIIISLLSWFSAISLIYAIIPEDFVWLSTLTVLFIGSYFGFIIYATFKERFTGYYHILGAISNAWAGLFAIYFCHQFPNGATLVLPVLIFIIFFGSYMVRLRWIAGFIAALTYTITYQVYIVQVAELSTGEVNFYAFVNWMVLVFAIFAGRVAEENNRIAFVQRRTIHAQSLIIEQEKEVLLKEVHHRVHNNLQIIVSLINLHVSKVTNQEVAKNLLEMQRRILAMALVHQRINHTSNFIEISLHQYANHLVENIQSQFEDVDFDYELTIPSSLQIDIETAIPLGMIMNEMISCFLQNARDKRKSSNFFSLEITRTPDDKLTLKFKDNGTELNNISQSDISEHLGLDLIDTLTNQLDGEFKFKEDQGASYTILF